MNRAAIAGILVTATWLAAAKAAPPSTAAPPIYTRQMAFTIPFRVGTAADPTQQPVEIQLHTSSDRGQTWTLIRAVPSNAASFAVRAPADGEYWFCVRTKDASGTVRPDGNFQPDLRVVVDTAMPEPTLNAWHGAAGELSAQWEIHDPNLDVASLELDYRAGDGQWQPIAFEGLPPGTTRETYVGMTTWVPAERAATYEVRLRIRDLAGNPTDHRTKVAANWSAGTVSGGAASGGTIAGNPMSGNAAAGANYPNHTAQPANPSDQVAANSWPQGGHAGGPADSADAQSRPLPRVPRSTVPVPQTIPRGGIPANVVPVQTNAKPGTSGSTGAADPYHAYGGSRYDSTPWHDPGQASAGRGNPGWDHDGTGAPGPLNHQGNPAANSYGGETATTPLPSVPWGRTPPTAQGFTHSGLDSAGSYRQPPNGSADFSGVTGQEPGSVAWPADNQSVQPLDRARLAPRGSGGKSAVQFQPLGATRPDGRAALPGDHGDGVTYPTDIRNARDEIHFQESNTGTPFQPPMASVSPTPSRQGGEASQRGRGSADVSSSVGARRPWMVRSRSFELKYDLPQAALRSRRVEVWGTNDGGQTWQRFAVDADGQSPAAVSTPAEGLYGFKLVVQNEQGLVEFPPARGDQPDVWVQVDLTRPNCRLVRAEQGRPPRDNELTIEWQADDDHLGALPVALEYARTLQGPWQVISLNLPNTGRYVWTMPERTPASFHLRLRVRDEAGNEGEFITAEAVSPVRPAAGRIFDVNPTQEAWEQSGRGRLYHFR